jgi:hypothetical protein
MTLRPTLADLAVATASTSPGEASHPPRPWNGLYSEPFVEILLRLLPGRKEA